MTFYISASRLKDYMDCRTFYYWRHVVRQPQTENTSALIGTAVHTAIDSFYKYNRNPVAVYRQTIQQKLAQWQDNELPILYRHTFADMMDYGDRLADFPFNQFTIGASEIPFTLPYSDTLSIRGIIDRISNHEIYDWKTAKRKPREITTDPQFTLYIWAYLQIHGELPHGAHWFHMADYTMVSYDMARYQEQLDRLHGYLLAMEHDTFEDIRETPCSTCKPWCHIYT